ncbi:hypothetical protein [Spirosoma arcticum]
MHKTLQETCDLLDDLHKSVLNGTTEDRDFSVINGWNLPSVNRHTLSNIPFALSEKIKEASVDDIEEHFEEEVEFVNQSLKNIKAQTLPYIFNSNGATAILIYVSTLSCIESTFGPLFIWKVISDNKALPPALARRLRSVEADLNDITPKK